MKTVLIVKFANLNTSLENSINDTTQLVKCTYVALMNKHLLSLCKKVRYELCVLTMYQYYFPMNYVGHHNKKLF